MKREQLIAEMKGKFQELFAPLYLEAWESKSGYEELTFTLKRKRFALLCSTDHRPTPKSLKERAQLLRREARTRGFKGGVGVLVERATSSLLEVCESLNMACFDLAGSCLLNQRGSYVKVLAPKPGNKRSVALETAFAGNRANVLRVILSVVNRIWSIDDLANASFVSGGQVSKALKPLVAVGWIEAKRGRGGIRVLMPSEIISAWSDHYTPIGTPLRYTSRDTVEQLELRLQKELQKADIPYAFTGFSGNALLTASGRYNEAAAYIVAPQLQVQRLAVSMGLTPSADFAKLTLYCVPDRAVMAGHKVIRGISVVNPVQVYLDLLLHPQRGAEAAALLRSMVMKF
ncbi:MAG: hypothetical protein HC853_00195 [Anaerolineae bacterium]|nr:hypothetical protein [Anaerolineae bacterium]